MYATLYYSEQVARQSYSYSCRTQLLTVVHTPLVQRLSHPSCCKHWKIFHVRQKQLDN